MTRVAGLRALLTIAAASCLAARAWAEVEYPTTGQADAPNYFLESPDRAEPLPQSPAQQADSARYAEPLQYPEQTAAVAQPAADAAQSVPGAMGGGAARPRAPLPLSPPLDEAAAGSAPSTRLTKPLVTSAASLGIVLGLFLLVVVIMRRSLPRGATALPKDVVEILGRAPFVGRQQVHLVRCANKLLLVCVSPTSAQTLTEITDPHEVEQMLIVCRGASSSGAEFNKVLEQFGQGHAGAPPRERRLSRPREMDQLDFSHLEALQHASREAQV